MRFIKKISLIIVVSFLLQGCNAVQEQDPMFWLWMSGSGTKTDQDWDADMKRISEAGFDGIHISADTALLKRIIPIADQYKLQVHAWIWTMNRADADSSWWSVNRLGKSLGEERAYVDYYKFMCPAIPEVKEFIKEKMDAYMAVDGLAGIHMDYIRYVDVILPVALQPKYGLVQDHEMPEFDYGYHPYMRELYSQQTGEDPMELDDPSQDTSWHQFRLDQLNKTVIEVRDHIRKREMMVSAAVFPTPEMSSVMVRQQWDQWGLDSYFPMVYHNFYNENYGWIEEVSRINREAIPETTRIYTGLYLPGLQEEGAIEKAVDAAMDGGADGVSFFSYGNMDEAVMIQLRAVISKYREEN